MKEMGYKGPHELNLAQDGEEWTFWDYVMGSPQWIDKMVHATNECERLGLDLSMGSYAG